MDTQSTIKNYKFSLILNKAIELGDIKKVNTVAFHIIQRKEEPAVQQKEGPSQRLLPRRNFVILRRDKVCVTFFQNSKVVGVTGIRYASDLDQVSLDIPTLSSQTLKIVDQKIDNITACGKLQSEFRLEEVYQYCKKNTPAYELHNTIGPIEIRGCIYTSKPKSLFGSVTGAYAIKACVYNPKVFPGLYIKTTNGTCALFKSGKYNLMGCKSTQKVADLEKYLFSIVQNSCGT